MKKRLLILAVAGLALASCSNDEVVESVATSDANVISFRPLTTGMTRAADVNSTSLRGLGFTVFATVSGGSTNYFPETLFTWNSTTSTYNSEHKYYWPSSGSLDFFAYAYSKPDGHATQVTHTALTKVFTVTPDVDAQYQTDLIVAQTVSKTKAGKYDPSDVYNSSATEESKTSSYGVNGVPINFRHAGCKVAITLYNGNTSNLNISVQKASICYVKDSGVFTFSDTNTDVNNSDGTGTILTSSSWADVTSPATNVTNYEQTDESSDKFNTATPAQIGQDWILIPQTFTYKTAYESTGEKNFEGPCIKVNLKIQNKTNSAYIVGDAENYITAMWPLKAEPDSWAIGKRYTYSVDLASGGYYPKDQNGDTVLDPILSGAEIKFVTVTVDSWNPEAGSVYTTNL